MKRTLIAALAFALAGTLSSCGDDEPEADPTPTESTSPATTPTADPTWDDKFTPAQIQRYEAARDVWLEYWDFYTGIARKGVDTPGVMRGFEKYSMNPLVEHSTFLDLFVRGGARMEVPPKVLWTNAQRITKDTVDFNYCLDHTNARTTVNGEIDPVDPPFRSLVSVRMRNTVEGWKVREYLNQGKEKPCGSTAP